MLIGINQWLNKMGIILGQHIVTLGEGEGPHDVVSKVREPSRHVLILAPECFRIGDLFGKEPNLVKNRWFVRSESGFTHSMRDDSPLPSMYGFVGSTREVLGQI